MFSQFMQNVEFFPFLASTLVYYYEIDVKGIITHSKYNGFYTQ